MTGASSFRVVAPPAPTRCGQASPTTCEITYDPKWYGRDFNSVNRQHVEDSSPFEEFFTLSDQTFFSDIPSKVQFSCRQNEEHNYEKTRSFTSLGLPLSSRRPFSCIDDGGKKRLLGYQTPCRSINDYLDPGTRESTDLSPNVDFLPGYHSAQSKLRWVDALNCWIPDKRPSQAFVTFVQGAPVKQRSSSPCFEESLQAHLSMSHEMNNQPAVGRRYHSAHVKISSTNMRNDDIREVDGKSGRVRRSKTIAISNHITKRSGARFVPLSRESQSSSSTLPPPPPPSMTPSKSANTSRSCPLPYPIEHPRGTTLFHRVKLLAEEPEQLDNDFSNGGLGDDNILPDVPSVVSYRSKSHSRQGSSSSVFSDLNSSIHSSNHSKDLYMQHQRKRVNESFSSNNKLFEEALSKKKISHVVPTGLNDVSDGKDSSQTCDSLIPDPLQANNLTREITPMLSTIEERDSFVDLRADSSKTISTTSNDIQISSPVKNFHQKSNRRPIMKKERKGVRVVENKHVKEVTKIPTPPLSPVLQPTDTGSADSVKAETDSDEDTSGAQDSLLAMFSSDIALPDMALPSLPVKISESKSKVKNKVSLPAVSTKGKKPRRRRSCMKGFTFEEEKKRCELGEERRKKQHLMMERHKFKCNRRSSTITPILSEKIEVPRFEDYDFLARYCIFDNLMMEVFRGAFEEHLDENKEWLSQQQVRKALTSLNTKLSETEDVYLTRILEVLGYDVCQGADFKLFSVIAALSRRISALDGWMKKLILNLDFKTLEIKLFIWKTLWECNVDKHSNMISLDELCVELRAGGVSENHVRSVRDRLGHLSTLDLLDFLTYIPLFIMIHEEVVRNPLSDMREK